MKPMMRARMIGKKVLRKPITFKEKRDALGIKSTGRETFINQNFTSRTEPQITKYDPDHKPKIGEISLHPKIRNNNQKLSDRNLHRVSEMISTIKKYSIDSIEKRYYIQKNAVEAINPKSEKEVVLKKQLLEKLKSEKEQLIDKTNTKGETKVVKLQALNEKDTERTNKKNKSILDKRAEARLDRQNKILVEKLDLVRNKRDKKTFSELVKDYYTYNTKEKSYTDSRIALHKIYKRYLKEHNKSYLTLDKNDISSIHTIFKSEIYYPKGIGF